VTAIVVLKNGEKLDEQMLMAKVQSKLSSFKGPKDGGAAADARVACNHSVQREPAMRINWRGWSTPPA
jgi:hypothetical protein